MYVSMQYVCIICNCARAHLVISALSQRSSSRSIVLRIILSFFEDSVLISAENLAQVARDLYVCVSCALLVKLQD